MSAVSRNVFKAPRVVLLVEVERYCSHRNCSHFNRIALTKSEARTYNGFDCERCERFNQDVLREPDIPEWWREISVISWQLSKDHND